MATKKTEQWSKRLRAYAAECRVAVPIPEREALSAADEQRFRIIGGSVVNWLRHGAPNFLGERAVLGKRMGLDPDPTIVFTSDIAGLVAAHYVLGSQHGRVVLLTEHELSSLPPDLTDEQYTFHVHFWSVFQAALADSITHEVHAKHPIPAGSHYWHHKEGTMWGEHAGQGVEHLWQWDGAEPQLLQEATALWVS